MSNILSSDQSEGTLDDRRESRSILHESMRDISALQFEKALVSIGQLADQVDRIVQSTGATIAPMSAQGDRIDRMQAHNRTAITALVGEAR